MKHTLIIAASIIIAGVVIGRAQQTSPASINGCIVSGTGPITTLSTNQQTVLTCNTLGQLRVTTTN